MIIIRNVLKSWICFNFERILIKSNYLFLNFCSLNLNCNNKNNNHKVYQNLNLRLHINSSRIILSHRSQMYLKKKKFWIIKNLLKNPFNWFNSNLYLISLLTIIFILNLKLNKKQNLNKKNFKGKIILHLIWAIIKTKKLKIRYKRNKIKIMNLEERFNKLKTKSKILTMKLIRKCKFFIIFLR